MGNVNTEFEIQSLKSIQQQLKNVGLYTGSVDGLFGEASLEAFRRILGGNTQVNNPHTFVAKSVFKSLQNALFCAGYNLSVNTSNNGIDGYWGKRSISAFEDVVRRYQKSTSTSSTFKFGTLSESRLIGVKPQLVSVIRRALELAPEDFGVREGLRSMATQREYVRRGVSKTTDSKHLTGDAVDIYPVKLPEGWQRNPFVWLPILKAVKQAAAEQGVKLRYGINWKNDPELEITTKFVDAPHIELA